MSLLMEALRKAEEAKRIAAQKSKENEGVESSPTLSTLPIAQDLTQDTVEKDLNETQTLGALEIEEPAEHLLDEFSFANEGESENDVAEKEESNLDIPFDFQIDESFGVAAEDSEPAVEIVHKNETPSSSQEIELGDDTVSADESSDNIIEFDLAPQVDSATDAVDFDGVNSEAEAEKENEFEATLEPEAELSTEPEPEVTAPASHVIVDDKKTSNEPTVAAVVVAETIRASRDEEPEENEVSGTKAKTERIVEKVGKEKVAEESRKRESARAVFSAKSPLKNSANKRKLLIAASVLALIPLAGGSYLLLSELGVIGSGNQYNIPASYTPGERRFDEPIELADNIAPAQVLPDVSDTGAVVLIAPEAIDTALESVVSAIAPEIAPNIAVPNEIIETDSGLVTPVPPVEMANVPADSGQAAPVANIDEAAIELPVEETPTEVASVETIAEVEPAQPASAEDNPISIVRSDNTTQVNPRLVQAYDAYNANDFMTARAHYQQALRDTPNSRDAMLGIAAVSLKMGDNTSARDTYLKLLELDPRDVLARVGLLETMPASDPIALESELKSLFSEHPEVAHLPFSLGNLYASQRRWNEAQQSYYDALLAAKSGSAGPVSPDYAFNLAVSLERLNQIRPAYQFYREALEQARVVNPTFDPRILRERLDALERQLP